MLQLVLTPRTHWEHGCRRLRQFVANGRAEMIFSIQNRSRYSWQLRSQLVALVTTFRDNEKRALKIRHLAEYF